MLFFLTVFLVDKKGRTGTMIGGSYFSKVNLSASFSVLGGGSVIDSLTRSAVDSDPTL